MPQLEEEKKVLEKKHNLLGLIQLTYKFEGNCMNGKKEITKKIGKFIFYGKAYHFFQGGVILKFKGKHREI